MLIANPPQHRFQLLSPSRIVLYIQQHPETVSATISAVQERKIARKLLDTAVPIIQYRQNETAQIGCISRP